MVQKNAGVLTVLVSFFFGGGISFLSVGFYLITQGNYGCGPMPMGEVMSVLYLGVMGGALNAYYSIVISDTPKFAFWESALAFMATFIVVSFLLIATGEFTRLCGERSEIAVVILLVVIMTFGVLVTRILWRNSSWYPKRENS